jgi:peptidoglycan/xylan/chitin deacetylase (PgdA/CDA1 family)
VVLTFDDGVQNNHTVAEPILRECGMKAICYLILGHIEDTDAERTSYRGHPNLTWEEVREMQKAGTFVFGIHSISHTADPVAQAAEAQPARHVFRAKTGVRTRSYCYPYGGSSQPIYEAVKRKGRYTTAMVCGDSLFVYDARCDLYRIPRISVFGGTHAFQAKLEAGAKSVEIVCSGNKLKALPALRGADGALHFPKEKAMTIGKKPVHFTWPDAPELLFQADSEMVLCDPSGTVEYARWRLGDLDHATSSRP